MNVVGKKGFLRLCILAVLPVLVSCVRTGIVSGVPVTYARPDRVVQASADTSFRRAFPEVLYIRDGRLIFRVMDGNGNTVKTFNLYDGIDGDRCLTRLSSIFSGNGDGMVAEAMTFFPQINIMDTETGRVTEDIGNITYDGQTGYLYCIDMDGNIVRYDLSELMPATTV